MEDVDYKLLHESLTSNNNGTTAFESTVVVVPSIISIYIVATLGGLLSRAQNLLPIQSQLSFSTEFLWLILPCIMSFTALADRIVWVFVAQIMVCFIIFILHQTGDRRSKYNETARILVNTKQQAIITYFRAITNMLSVLCILAVDFHIFPRRFAKTETFGYSVMDLGVGLFIIANALVAPEARSAEAVNVSVLKSTLHCVILIVLGMGRLILTYQLDYQEHVTEYGKHWNFFFTLAATKLSCSIILKFLKHHTGVYMLLSLLIVTLYETILHFGVREWILSNAPRDDFVCANREGLYSNLGYVALYFGGVTLGRVLQKWVRLDAVNNWSAVMKLGLIALILWALTMLCDSTVGVSRRLANMGYFFWILSFSTTVLAFSLIVELFIHLQKVICVGAKKNQSNPYVRFVPNLMAAINANGLIFFLLGNVLTGLINVIVDTFRLDPVTSFIVITLYMLVNCATVSLMYKRNIVLKI